MHRSTKTVGQSYALGAYLADVIQHRQMLCYAHRQQKYQACLLHEWCPNENL